MLGGVITSDGEDAVGRGQCRLARGASECPFLAVGRRRFLVVDRDWLDQRHMCGEGRGSFVGSIAISEDPDQLGT